MLVKLSSSALKQTRWYEYGIRFLLGGLATVFAGIVSARFGTAVGGLFLALPAIFCASATLIESHERRAKEKAGLDGRRRGRQAAALDAAGAALGSIGLAAFAAVFYVMVSASVVGAFATAILAWAMVAVLAWWVRRKLRISARPKRPERWERSARDRSFIP
jgi:MFS family permease